MVDYRLGLDGFHPGLVHRWLYPFSAVQLGVISFGHELHADPAAGGTDDGRDDYGNRGQPSY